MGCFQCQVQEIRSLWRIFGGISLRDAIDHGPTGDWS